MEKIKKVDLEKLKGSNIDIDKLKHSIATKERILRNKKVVRK